MSNKHTVFLVVGERNAWHMTGTQKLLISYYWPEEAFQSQQHTSVVLYIMLF